MTNRIIKKIRRSFSKFLRFAKPIHAKAANNAAYSYIDISQWQGAVNFAKVKAAGVQGIIIRIGYGDVISYPSQIDKQFDRNYSECKRLGIPVGAYFYCYATTVKEAQREAQGCLSLIKGKQFELPILYDVEEQDTFSKGHSNEVIKAFADILEAAGWWVGIYSYKCAADAYFTERTKTRYTMAIAQYASICTYTSQHAFWQNSSTWKVDGISGNVDHDWCYVDYPTLIKERGKNGYPKPIEKVTVTKDTPIVRFEGTAKKGSTCTVKEKKTVCGVQYGRVTDNGWISLKDAKQVK